MLDRRFSILLFHIIGARPSKQPLRVRTFLKVYMDLGSYFLFLQEQIKDIIIISPDDDGPALQEPASGLTRGPEHVPAPWSPPSAACAPRMILFLHFGWGLCDRLFPVLV